MKKRPKAKRKPVESLEDQVHQLRRAVNDGIELLVARIESLRELILAPVPPPWVEEWAERNRLAVAERAAAPEPAGRTIDAHVEG